MAHFPLSFFKADPLCIAIWSVFVAFDFILRLIRVGMMRVSLVVDVLCMDLNNPATDTSGSEFQVTSSPTLKRFAIFILFDARARGLS